MKLKDLILIIAGTFIIGFFAGRATTTKKETVRFIKGETIIAEYPSHLLLPKREIKGNLADLPTYYFITDTIIRNDTAIIEKKADTIRVFDDFMTKRDYDFVLIDSEYGIVNFEGTVQFNALQTARGKLIPLRKEITRTVKPTLEPFASASYNTFSIAGIGGGLFYKNTGIGYKYLHNIRTGSTGHEAGIIIKF